jgi:hypothetical protein
LGAKVTPSFAPFPVNGDQLAAPAAEKPPLEGIQFSLPDGTLVTRYAQVGRSRHGRERGEEWNEIGYGRNDTVDAAGNPVDKGPGAYLNFVAQYFDGRSWGVEIIDNSRVAGVSKPTLRVNQYFQQAQRAGGHSFFRGFDRPGVTGFGWMSPGQLVNPSLYQMDAAVCQVQPKPPEGRLANASGLNDGCSVTLDNYPGHSELSPDANGVLAPNGRSVPARSLQVGDVIEVTMSFFSTPEAMAAAGNKGTGHRYYTNELTYVVGSGLRPQYGVQPRLMNAALPEETWQGGLGSVSYDYADNSEFMFQQPHNHIGMQNMQRFLDGRRWFHTNMRTGDHNEPGNERNAAAVGLQGDHFTGETCFSCHHNNGRGMAPVVEFPLDSGAILGAIVDLSEASPVRSVHRWHPEQSVGGATGRAPSSCAARNCASRGGVHFMLVISETGRRLGPGSRWQSRHQLILSGDICVTVSISSMRPWQVTQPMPAETCPRWVKCA